MFVAEIGDITRFHRPEQLASWAGLTPKHHESDTTVHRGRITKQGSRLVRWAAVEAVQRVSGHTRLGQTRDRIGERRGRNIGVVAAARELITLVFYGLRDHHIRCLPAPASPRHSRCRSGVVGVGVSSPVLAVGADRAGHDPRTGEPVRRGRPL